MSKVCNRKMVGSGFAIAASAVAFAAITSFATSAKAAVLLAGNTGSSAVTPTQLTTLPAGDVIVPGASETNSFSGVDASHLVHFSGTLTSQVFSDPKTGGLDFVYTVMSNASSIDDIERLSLSSFYGFTTDADYTNVNITDIAPSTADRSASGSVVGFNFDNGLPGGDTTSQLIVETDAQNYTRGSGSLIDGAVGGALVQAPTVGMLTVPEPTTFAVLTLVGGMVLGRRRR